MLTFSFIDLFIRTILPEPIRQLARQTGWSKRQGKIDPFEFLLALSFGQSSAFRSTLTSLSQGMSIPVTRQAINQRFNPEGVEWIKACFTHVMAETFDLTPTHPQAEQLRAHFPAVYLLDSTSFDTAENLKEVFPACGGAGSAANIKVLLRYEVIAGRLEPLCLLAGKRSDQGQAVQAAERLLEGQLCLNDKGFHDSKAWAIAEQRKAFLLMPLSHSLTLWTIDEHGKESSLNLAEALGQSQENRVEWAQIYTGKAGHRAGPLRLVAFRLSIESAARQRQGLRESMRKQGKTPTDKALELAGWLLLITNAPALKLPSSAMAYLYRVRWQVELIFRQTKSVLRLDKSESEKTWRIQCEVWARLLAAVLLFWWHAHASAECWQLHRQEVSFEKLIRLMQQWGLSIMIAFIGGPVELKKLFRQIWDQILVNARKEHQKTRSTSWQNLADYWLNPKTTTF
jgi:hypothetical protein